MNTERERALNRFFADSMNTIDDLLGRVDDLLFSLFLWRLSTVVLAIILIHNLFWK